MIDNVSDRAKQAKLARARVETVAEVDTTSIWTLPNAISALRVALVPGVLWAALSARPGALLVLLATVGLSDWADGVVARQLRQVSALGQVFDPICDRIAVGGTLVALLAAGYVPMGLGVALLAREAVISAATVVLAIMGWPRIEVAFLGKVATLMLMFSFPLFVVAEMGADASRTANVLAWAFALPGTLLYYVTLGLYAHTAWRLRPMGSQRPAGSGMAHASHSGHDEAEILPSDSLETTSEET